MPEPRTNNNLIIHRLIPLEPFGTLIRVRDFIVEMSEGKFGLGGGGGCSCAIGDNVEIDMQPHTFQKAAEELLDEKALSYLSYGRDMCWWAYAVDIGGKAFSNFAQSSGNGSIDVLSEIMEFVLCSEGDTNISLKKIEETLSALDASSQGIRSIQDASHDERIAVEKLLRSKLQEETGHSSLVDVSLLTDSSAHYTTRIFDKNYR